VVRHTYQKGGSYRATLTVDDGKETTCSVARDVAQVNVNATPVVSVEDVQATCVGKAVAFKAAASDADGDKVNLTWDFGDGTTAQGGTSMTHTYSSGGFFAVTVTADDGRGSTCSISSAKAYVEVNSPPAADAGENQVCCLNQEVTFDGSGSSDPDDDQLSYNWNFGDGGGAEGVKVKHTYDKSGTFKVTLDVNDGSGTPCNADSDGFTAVVNAKPVPVIEIR
jgi:PKD repeat protein